MQRVFIQSSKKADKKKSSMKIVNINDSKKMKMQGHYENYEIYFHIYVFLLSKHNFIFLFSKAKNKKKAHSILIKMYKFQHLKFITSLRA
jgi:hypothetical protein